MPEIAYSANPQSLARLVEPLARVYLLVGSDDALKREVMLRLYEAGLDESFADFDRMTIDLGAGGNAADDSDDPAVRVLAAASAAPFGSPRKVVTVLSIQRLAKERQAALAEGLTKLGALSLLILTADAPEYEAGRPKGRQVETALKKAVALAGVVVVCDAPQAGDLKARARALVAQSGKTADEAALSLLAAKAGAATGAPGAGGDLNTLIQETEKLITYVGERTQITAKDVSAVVASSSEENIFPLLDAVGARNVKKALELTDALLSCGDKPDAVAARTLVMLQRHMRLLCLAKFLSDRKLAARSGLPPEIKDMLSGELVGVVAGQAYRVPGYMRQAAGFTWEELTLAMERILSSDLAMKGIVPGHSLGQTAAAGSDDPAANLRLLILSLCRMKQAAGSA